MAPIRNHLRVSTALIKSALLILAPSFALFAGTPVLAQEQRIQNYSTSGLSLETVKADNPQGGSTLTVIARFAKGIVPSVEELTEPSRILIDLPSVQVPSNRTFSLPPNTLLRAVRLGAHNDKTRIVLDVESSASGTPLIEIDQRTAGTVRIVLAEHPQEDSPVVTPTFSPTPTMLPTSRPTPAPSPSASPLPSPSPTARPFQVLSARRSIAAKQTPQPTQVPAPAPSPEPTPITLPTPEVVKQAELTQGSELKLISLSFESTPPGATPVIKIETSGRPQFKLSRQDEHTFRLLIEGATLSDKRLLMPYFPPADFVGINMVMAEHTSSGVSVLITVEHGVRLASSVRSQDIFVRAVLPGAKAR